MNSMRVAWAALRLQAALAARSPLQALTLFATPLFSLIFLSVVAHADRPDVAVNAVVAPGLTGLWSISLQLSGAILDEDRWQGRLELLAAARASLSLVVLGRILLITLVGSVAFAESWLVAVVGFDFPLAIRNPEVLVLSFIGVSFATACTATALAACFVLSRELHVFQNSLNYPLYLLGGVVVPVSMLPHWVTPVSKLMFLSWGADLLRDSIRLPTVHDWPVRLGVVLALGAIALGGGVKLIDIVIQRARTTGSAGYA
jgi:ABC-2 type transport system permease protein